MDLQSKMVHSACVKVKPVPQPKYAIAIHVQIAHNLIHIVLAALRQMVNRLFVKTA